MKHLRVKILKNRKFYHSKNIEEAENKVGVHCQQTQFFKRKQKKFDVIVGMYHDQVLAPMKTIFGFKAINITIGLPFIRVTPDHGPNYEMFGLNKSKPDSLIEAFSFINKYGI